MADVGIIGLGRMGGSIGRHLLDTGYSVVGFDIDDSAVEAFVDAGGDVLEAPASVAAVADVVLTSLPSPSDVEATFRGADGVFEGATGRTTALELSTIDPDTSERIASTCPPGLAFADAPVSGGPGNAREGTLTVMVGGDRHEFESTTLEIIEAMGTTSHFLGRVGAGHTTKLVNNAISMGTLLLSLEALALSVTRGVDARDLYEVILNAGGSSNQFAKRVPRVLNRNFEAGFSLAFSRKDLDLGLAAADAVDYPMIVTSVIHQLYTEAAAAGYGAEDAAAVVKLFEDSAGVTVDADSDVDESFKGY